MTQDKINLSLLPPAWLFYREHSQEIFDMFWQKFTEILADKEKMDEYFSNYPSLSDF